MNLPNFIIIGCAKAGTTSLYHYLKEHPDVFMPELKELRYFAYDKSNPEHIKKPDRVYPIRSMDAYKHQFSKVKNETAIGEASPRYINSAFAAHKIHRIIPHAKLILSIRNPVDKLYSAYNMEVRDGRASGDIEKELFDSQSLLLHNALIYDKLKLYLSLFDASQIKIILFDDLIRDATKEAQSLYRFLNVDSAFTPNTQVKHNLGGVPKSGFMAFAHNVYRNNKLVNKMYKALMPDKLRGKLYAARRGNIEKYASMPDSLKERLSHYYRTDVLKTQELIQQDLSPWLSN
ncbi:sulfotransferase family protein [Alkalimarinus coralli]|uniref:sulfotransferase family protein n=1 Tax=Alkalimarinus coralli TaxID=2935863 RepID=UPI00202B1345|nr:sulfotransferase [Alkalimarinus coralli]